MGTLLQDVKYGIRMLTKAPGFTAVAALTLALGIGANTAMFSTINAMLLRPFPFQDLDRAVTVRETVPVQNRDHMEVAPANFRDFQEQAKGFELLAAERAWSVNLTGRDLAERVEGYQVTANFFQLLGIRPELGRAIGADNFGAGRNSVVVLSHGFWQRHLGADSTIAGKNVLLNGQKYTVIGIMPSDFDFPVGAEAWAPLDFTVSEQSDRANHYLEVFGRLKSGVSREKAQDDLESIAARLGQEYPGTNAGHSARVMGLVDDLTYGTKQFVGVLMAAAGFVLLLACANVANLLLARVTGRQKEIAVRLALGASRWHIAQQLMVESTLVSVMGGVAGLFLAAWHLDFTQSTLPPFIVQHVPGLKHLQAAWHVLAFTVVLALVLLVSAGLMVEGFRNMANEDLGFDRSHVLTFRVSLAESKYRNADLISGFYERLVLRLQSLPGVESAAAVTAVPGSWWGWASAPYSAEGQPAPAPGEIRSAGEQSVTSDFFRALRVPLIKGRFISPQDGTGAPLVVDISEGLARQIWPHEDALGKRVRFDRPENNGPWRTVVGVVGSVRSSPWEKQADLTAYFPLAQAPQASTGLVVRTSGDPLASAAAVRSQVLGLDSEQPPYDLRSLEQLISDNVSGVESSAREMMVFGILALVLAAAGIFAVMAFSVL